MLTAALWHVQAPSHSSQMFQAAARSLKPASNDAACLMAQTTCMLRCRQPQGRSPRRIQVPAQALQVFQAAARAWKPASKSWALMQPAMAHSRARASKQGCSVASRDAHRSTVARPGAITIFACVPSCCKILEAGVTVLGADAACHGSQQGQGLQVGLQAGMLTAALWRIQMPSQVSQAFQAAARAWKPASKSWALIQPAIAHSRAKASK